MARGFRWLGRLIVPCAVAGLVMLAAPAGADSYVGVTPPRVGGAEAGAAAVFTPVAAAGQSRFTTQAATSGLLPLTGGDIAGLVLLGGVCVGIGVLMRGAAHRPARK